MQLIPVNTARIAGIVRRLGIVLYTGCLLIAVFISYVDSPHQSGAPISPIFWTIGVSLLTSLAALEIVRRTVMFIFAEESIASKRFPLVFKIFFAVSVLLFIISGCIHLFHDIPLQTAIQRQQAAKQLAEYQEAVGGLSDARLSAAACYEKAKNTILSEPEPESAQCRQERLNYNACRDIGSSYTFCISLYDYESACKSGNSNFAREIKLEAASTSCNSLVTRLEATINLFEEAHGTSSVSF